MFRRPTYAEAFASPVPNGECIAKNIIHPNQEKSSENRRKHAERLNNKMGQVSACLVRVLAPCMLYKHFLQRAHRRALTLPYPFTYLSTGAVR
jgi:hypothetical protein